MADDPIAEALAAVRGVKADMFSTQSSVLGKLPGPAELAAAQPDFRQLLRSRGPLDFPFTPQQRRALATDYTYYTFVGKPRLADCIPLGISGVHARDIAHRAELLVVAIEPDSPAAGLVEPDDIIIGANGRLFDDPMDSRPAMGFALVESQTARLGGKLSLQIVRKGKAMNVTLDLGQVGEHKPTWPFDCEKTRQIAAATLRFVKAHAPPAEGLFGRHSGGGFWTPLFLMASGDAEGMEMVCRWAQSVAAKEYERPTKPGNNCWVLSYRLVNLCEYYLLTGDSLVLPAIRWHVEQLSLNQYKVGTWGHGMPTGYGPINNVGLVVFTGLILARECGVTVNPHVMARSIRFFGKFCGTNFPYGEGSPGGRSGRMDNGMNSMAAVAFHLLGEEAMARRWARSVCYMWAARERGHAEGIFNWSWGPLGAVLAPEAEFGMFMRNTLWYYELMRTREGGFVFLRYGSTDGGRFSYAAGATPAIALPLYLPKRRLRILGAPRGVFGTRPPAGLQEAADLYRHKRWKEMTASLSRVLAGASGPATDYANRLQDAYRRLEAHAAFTLALARANIKAGKEALAAEQLDTLTRLLGEKRPEIVKLRSALPAEPRKPRPAKEPVQSIVKPSAALFAAKKPPTGTWGFLVPPAGEKGKSVKQPYVARKGPAGKQADLGRWVDPGYEPAGWQKQTGAIKLAAGEQVWIRRRFVLPLSVSGYAALRIVSRGAGEVYLNGYKLADVSSNETDLRPGAVEALRAGPNVLAARLTVNKGAADIALKAVSRIKPKLGDLRGDL